MTRCAHKGLTDCIDCPLFSDCELMDARCFAAELDECDKHPSCEGCPATIKPEPKKK